MSSTSDQVNRAGYLKIKMTHKTPTTLSVQNVLQRCDPTLSALCDSGEELDPAGEKLLFLQDRRRVQKVGWRQLFVLDSMMCELERVQSAQQLLTQPCPPQSEGEARGHWKALKVESRTTAEHTEELVNTLQKDIIDKRHKVKQLLQQLQAKKQQREDLQASVKEAQKALQTRDGQLTRLMAELEAELGQVDVWQHCREALQSYVAAVQEVAHVTLLSFNQSQVSLELRPHTPANTKLAFNELEPLKLSIIWSQDDHFTLQIDPESLAKHLQEDVSGRPAELSAALVEVMENYVGQADLLAEIQSLRSSFAIDWCPAQRVLVYLKSASILCHLEVQEGYPNGGAVRLRDVQRDGQPLNTDALQPRNPDGSLTDWLVFLCTNPLI
ncbi:uncharacterized protein si:dkey-225f5.4 [Hippocampus zosterae]|uniref:uncharacterized protein si:dkey-225f5.4 n=1 Tax=Hippocampus zosterae TaxID=109293 RepID=UPI00223D2F2E|nr:uncharacterized protein si:dkey-225f5.4 [Hippocampus zosterae]